MNATCIWVLNAHKFPLGLFYMTNKQNAIKFYAQLKNIKIYRLYIQWLKLKKKNNTCQDFAINFN